jgi:hypothetical protein
MFSPIQTPDGKFATSKPDLNAIRSKAAQISAVDEFKKTENFLNMQQKAKIDLLEISDIK